MRVKVGEIYVNCELSGNLQGPTLVLSHSLGSSMEMWEPQLAALEPRFRVLRYDTRGHGGTEAPEPPYTLEQLADDAAGLLDALQIGRVHFVGLSMGGMVGQCLALRHPARLETLALCDTAAVIPAEAQPVWQQRIETARRAGMGALVQETLERWFTEGYRRQGAPWVERIGRIFRSTPVAGFVGCSEAIRRLDFLGRLNEVRQPTLIVVGEEDPGTPVAAAEAMHSVIPGSSLVVIPNAAHLSNVEQPEAFNRALGGFLDRWA